MTSRRCVSVTNKKVRYHNKLRISVHGQPCEYFPRIWFDRHAKFGCHLSYCVCVHVTDPKNFGDAGARPPWDRDMANH